MSGTKSCRIGQYNVRTGVPDSALGVEAQHDLPLQSGGAFRRAEAPRKYDVARGELFLVM